MYPKRLGAAEKILKSPIFILIVILWILFSVSLVAVPQPNSFYTDFISASGKVPQYQSSVLISRQGSNITVYSQTFTMYGKSASGWEVNYSLYFTNEEKNVRIESGNAGVTNSSGMVRYNLTEVFNFNTYLLSETVNNRDGSWANYSMVIVSFLNYGGPYLHASLSPVSITPVVSSNNPRYFAIHIWRIPQNNSENYSVVYGIAPGNSISTVFNWTQTGAFPDHLLNFSMKTQKNIQTPFNYTGEPYYYGVGVKNERGSTIRTVVFGSIVSNDSKMEDFEFLSFVALSVFLVFLASYIGIYLCITPKNVRKSGKVIKFLTRGIYRPKCNTGLERFKVAMSSSLLLSVPFIFTTSIIVYIFSISFYGKTPDITTILSYSLAAFLTVAFAASLTLLLAQSMVGKILRLFIDNVQGKTSIKVLAIILLYSVTYLYFSLIGDLGILSLFVSSTKVVEKITVILYSVNPLSYLWLLGAYLSKSLSANGLFVFNPSSIFLGPIYIASIGMIWIILLIILPWAIFRKKDESKGTVTM